MPAQPRRRKVATIRQPRLAGMPKARLSEADFQKQVLQYATLRGWRSHHEYDSRRSTPGYPDWLFLRLDGFGIGRLIFAELKTERGRVRPEQREWLHDLATVPNVEVYVWRPSQWLEIEKLLW